MTSLSGALNALKGFGNLLLGNSGQAPEGQDTQGRTFRPLDQRPLTPTHGEFPHANAQRARARPTPRRRAASVSLDDMQASAQRTDANARQNLESAKVQLRRLKEDPTKKLREAKFTVDFGTTTVAGKPKEHKIQLQYHLRHNGFVAAGKAKDIRKQADHTRLLLQGVYNQFNDDLDMDGLEKHKKLSILRNMERYDIQFSEDDAGNPHIKVIIEDSNGKKLRHTFKNDLKLTDKGVKKTVKLTEYIETSRNLVDIAAKEVPGFAKHSGHEFFQRMIEAGGIVHHALAQPQMTPRKSIGGPDHKIGPSNLHSMTDQRRDLDYQRMLQDQQNRRLADQAAQTRAHQAGLMPPGAVPSPGSHPHQSAFQPIHHPHQHPAHHHPHTVHA